jgi:hypothetical protein
VMETLRAVAATRGIDADVCAAQIIQNFKVLFGKANAETR